MHTNLYTHTYIHMLTHAYILYGHMQITQSDSDQSLEVTRLFPQETLFVEER